MGDSNKRTVVVIGHKNPDTDSICSAISYAYLKNQLDPEHNYIPCRAGTVNAETAYVLDKFGVESPLFLNNMGTRVKDMEIREVPGVQRSISVKEAYTKMRSLNVFTLPITDEEKKLRGLITINDIAKSYMEEFRSDIVSVAKTPYKNILETLEGTMIVGDPETNFEQGKVIIAAANPDVMEQYIEEHDMVILGNRYEGQLCAIEMNAGCIVVCLGAPVSRTIQHMAQERGCTIIVTPLDTYTVARLINQSMPVEFFMKSENLITFHKRDFTDDIREVMSKKRYRDFPIVNKEEEYLGMISRRNLLGVTKRDLILVDHNEVSQAVDNVEDANILEILDHHRIGTLETLNPVYFRNQPVGCTATIIWQMFLENDVEIPRHIAGLLCSAILSDTLLFRSPTCTSLDRKAAERLAAIAGIVCEDYAKGMFRAGSDLSGRTTEEIFYQDFKTFDIGDKTLGIGQVSSMSQTELDEIKVRLKTYMGKKIQESREWDMIFIMLTNILDESTDMICFGDRIEELVEDAFPGAKVVDHEAHVTGVVSRKKQVVPALIAGMSRGQEL